MSSLRRSSWDHQSIAEYQARALVNMMRYAVSQVPYYRRLGIVPGDIQSKEDLWSFPIITKDTVQQFGSELIADGYNRSALESSVTSGSSGQPTRTYFDNASWIQCKYSLKIKRMVESGVGLFNRVVIASEYAPTALKTTKAGFLPGSGLFFRQHRISVHESPSTHIEIFKSFRPSALYTFPSYVSELISYCEDHSVLLPNIPVVFTSSEVLRPQIRERIEDFFGAHVCDVYGSTEFKEVAWQCKMGRYHLNFESVYVEPTDMLGNEPASLVLSTLLNKAMPLLRFRIGDFGVIKHDICSCGRESPYIDSILGREVDVLELPSGRRVSPYVLITHSIDHTPEIKKYQFVQTAPERLEIRVTLKPGGRSLKDLEPIANEISARLDDEIDVELIPVEQIPRTKGGKHKDNNITNQ